MDHALLVGVLQAEGGLADEIRRRASTASGPSCATSRSRLDAIDELHHEEVQVAGLVGVVGGDDVGVRQPGGGSELAVESLDGLRIGQSTPG